MSKNIITCGLDVALKKTGISVFVNGIYKTHALIDLHKIKNKDERFKSMCENILFLLSEYKPDIIAIERMHTLQQIETFRRFCKIAGMIELYAWQHDCFYVELSPSEWRAGAKSPDEKVTGYKPT